MRIKGLTVEEVRYVAHRLATELMSENEPIPDFDTRYPDKLESCISAPFQTWDKKPLHQGLALKSSVLFYLMIKNHPFQNGNKRIAVTTLLYFLFKNEKWIKVDNQSLYNFAKWVASSDPMFRDETVKATEKFIAKYVVELDKK